MGGTAARRGWTAIRGGGARWLVTLGLVALATGALLGGRMAGGPSAAGAGTVDAASESGALFVPIAPVRVLDTREGLGSRRAPMRGGETIELQVTAALRA